MSTSFKRYEAKVRHPDGEVRLQEIQSNGTEEQIRKTFSEKGLEILALRVISQEELASENDLFIETLEHDHQGRLNFIKPIVTGLAELANYEPRHIQKLIEFDQKHLEVAGNALFLSTVLNTNLEALRCLLEILPRLEQCRQACLKITEGALTGASTDGQ